MILSNLSGIASCCLQLRILAGMSPSGVADCGGFRHGQTGQPAGAASVRGRQTLIGGAVRALLTIILINWHIGAPCRRPCLLRQCRAQEPCEMEKGGREREARSDGL